MSPTRRDFLRVSTVSGIATTVLGFDLTPAYAQAQALKISRTTETRSTCPYCSVSCGVIIYTIGDKAKNVTPQVVHVEGDPDHPINRGTLCPKGSSLMQDILNDEVPAPILVFNKGIWGINKRVQGVSGGDSGLGTYTQFGSRPWMRNAFLSDQK